MSRLALQAALLAFGGALPGAEPGAGAAAGGDRPSREVPAALQSRYGAAVLERESAARIVTVGILFPAGSSEDPPGREGTAALLAGVLRRQGAPALARHGAAVTAELSESDLHLTLMAPRDAWREAFVALETLLYESPLSGDALEAARDEVAGILAFEAGAPGRAFDLERARLLRGADAPGARPALGTPASTGSLTLADLEAFRGAHLRPEEATLAAHGPVEPSELASLVGTDVEEVRGARVAAGSPRPGTLPAGWETGGADPRGPGSHEQLGVRGGPLSSGDAGSPPQASSCSWPGRRSTRFRPSRASSMPMPRWPRSTAFLCSCSPRASIPGSRPHGRSGWPAWWPPWRPVFPTERSSSWRGGVSGRAPSSSWRSRKHGWNGWREGEQPASHPSPMWRGEILDLDRNAVLRTAALAGPARVIVFGPGEMMGR